jgi:putative salt-induced outer membrane protein YdiY
MQSIPRAASSFVLVLLACATGVRAQEEVLEEGAVERRWKNTAELALVQTSGNAESFTFSLRDNFVWNWASSSLTSEIFALRGEATNRILTNEGGAISESSETEVTAEQYALSSKYDRSINERLGWYGNLAWERNELSGIDSRFGAGVGVSYLFFENDVRKLIGEAGLGYVSEKPVSGDTREFARGRLFGRYERKISETSGFETEVELLPNLEDTDDLLVNFLAAVTASITSKMALRLSYTVAYDNQPIVVVVEGDDPDEPDGMFEFESADAILSASLVINF